MTCANATRASSSCIVRALDVCILKRALQLRASHAGRACRSRLALCRLDPRGSLRSLSSRLLSSSPLPIFPGAVRRAPSPFFSYPFLSRGGRGLVGFSTPVRRSALLSSQPAARPTHSAQPFAFLGAFLSKGNALNGQNQVVNQQQQQSPTDAYSKQHADAHAQHVPHRRATVDAPPAQHVAAASARSAHVHHHHDHAALRSGPAVQPAGAAADRQAADGETRAAAAAPRLPLSSIVSVLVDEWSRSYTVSALQGDVESMCMLASGHFSKSGWGCIPHDTVRGHDWLRRAKQAVLDAQRLEAKRSGRKVCPHDSSNKVQALEKDVLGDNCFEAGFLLDRNGPLDDELSSGSVTSLQDIHSFSCDAEGDQSQVFVDGVNVPDESTGGESARSHALESDGGWSSHAYAHVNDAYGDDSHVYGDGPAAHTVSQVHPLQTGAPSRFSSLCASAPSSRPGSVRPSVSHPNLSAEFSRAWVGQALNVQLPTVASKRLASPIVAQLYEVPDDGDDSEAEASADAHTDAHTEAAHEEPSHSTRADSTNAAEVAEWATSFTEDHSDEAGSSLAESRDMSRECSEEDSPGHPSLQLHASGSQEAQDHANEAFAERAALARRVREHYSSPLSPPELRRAVSATT